MYRFLYYNGPMKTLSFSHARANLAATFDAVIDDAEETVITRSGHEPVVVLSLSKYEAMRETMYLLRSPANAERLLRSVKNLESGGGRRHELIDIPADEPATA